MKIVFLSNFYNHHQAPFCKAMYKHLGEDFYFVQTKDMGTERLNMGWGESDIPAFIKKSYDTPEAEAECNALIDNADAVIIGSAPEHFIKKRIKNGGLVLRYSERQLKKGFELWKYPYRFLKWHKKNPRKGKIYLLCASAYTAPDYHKFGLFKNRAYKWGYFPETRRYEDVNKLIKKKDVSSILWVARLINLKHPETPVLVAKKLKEEGYSFKMSLIGNGILEEKIKSLIVSFNVGDCVQMLGSMKPHEVRDQMERAKIFLFTSDRNEGWGAVLNEAMNSACSVIACNAVGSAPFLINGENGLTYEEYEFEELYTKVKLLLDEPDIASNLGKKAYETIVHEWNAETAAERLLHLIDDLNEKGSSDAYSHGPCSKATYISKI